MLHLQNVSDDPELKEHFGSLWGSWMSLLQAMSGGIDWGDLAKPLIRVGFLYALAPFLVYMFFMLIVVMNVFTGIFLGSCSQKAKEEKEFQLLRNAFETFKLSDPNGNNIIAKADFKASLKHRSVHRFFDVIDLDMQQAEVLFELLDTSGDGQISCDEFLRGCLRLRGHAKALDLLVLSREVNQLIDGVVAVTRQNAASLMRNREMINQVMHTNQDNYHVLHRLLQEIRQRS